jgi:hypothetical protein
MRRLLITEFEVEELFCVLFDSALATKRRLDDEVETASKRHGERAVILGDLM